MVRQDAPYSCGEVWKFGSLEVWMEKRGKAAAEKEEVGKVGSVEVGSVGEAFF